MYGVHKRYPNGAVALSDINLTIEKGEFVFIVGASGAGKSTILRLINREALPTRGQVLVGGRNIVRMPAWEVPYLRRRMGVVFQDFKLLPNKTVFENVSFALEVTETPTKDIKRRVTTALELVGLRHVAQALPRELSGGEQQRVSIARAIVSDPVVLLADEPTGNLDPATSWDITTLLYEINKRGTTVIMATHNREIVDTMKKRVIALDHGKIIRDDPRGVYDHAD